MLGPVWYGMRGIWNWSFAFVILEAFACVQIGRGYWGDLAVEERGRLSSVEAQIGLRQDQLDAAVKRGDANVDVFERNIQSLQDILADIQLDIQQAEDSRMWIIVLGIGMLLAVKVLQGVLANTLLERRYSEWLSDRTIKSRVPVSRVALSVLFAIPVYVASIIHYTVPGLIPALADFPTDRQIRLTGIDWIEAFFDYIIIIVFLVTLTGLSAGPRAAVWTGAFLVYTGLVGLWEKAMTSLALLGTAACISISIGIPLGMYCARRPRVYGVVRPIMDFMQTMPAFVYMIEETDVPVSGQTDRCSADRRSERFSGSNATASDTCTTRPCV